MHMALFSVRYGFIPARVSKSSYEPLRASARFGDEWVTGKHWTSHWFTSDLSLVLPTSLQHRHFLLTVLNEMK